jgi:hypothetical protein
MNGSTTLLSYRPVQYGENQLHSFAGPINITVAKLEVAMSIIPKLVIALEPDPSSFTSDSHSLFHIYMLSSHHLPGLPSVYIPLNYS